MKWIWGVSLGVAFGAGTVMAAQEAPKPAKPAAPVAPAVGTDAKAPDAKSLEFFETKIRPLFAQQCFACHGEKVAKGGLRMHTAEAFLKGGDQGKLIDKSNPERSLLLDALSHKLDYLKMPPQGKLKPQEMADLTAWVKSGASWPNAKPVVTAGPGNGQLFTEEQRKFWAFQTPRLPKIPGVKNAAWVKNPIDAFILARLEAAGLKPSVPADRRTLIRRVNFDLTGLPPTPEEVEAFVADRSPDAFAKVVDRLLASTAYGERWGRHWLDVARYADSNGLDENTAFGNAWRYRDYVVDAFNQDKPYDQFIREQIAGDLLPASQDPAENRARLIATGYLGLGPKVLAEPDKEKMVMDIVDEQIDTVSKSVMGLTIACARCHDHKFDPLPTRDYYGLAGIFKSTRTMSTLNTVARVLERPLSDPSVVTMQEAHKKEVEAREEELRKLTWQANSQATAPIVAEAHRYLLVGLEADVAAARSATGQPDLNRPGTMQLEAEKFTRADVQVNTTTYGQGIGIIESAGRSAAFAEYEFELARPEGLDIFLRLASGESRPVKVSLDGREIASRAASKATGGFGPKEQVWSAEGSVKLAAGKHVLRIDQASSSLPHIDRIALVPVAGEPVAVNGSAKPRSAKPADLAKQHNLDAELLRRSAAYLRAAEGRANDPLWEPWRRFSALPQATFAVDAKKVTEEWQASGAAQSWNPRVAKLFATAPASLAVVAERYQGLLQEANEAWLRAQEKAKNPPARLGDANLEAVRQVLYGGSSAFGLEKAERFSAPATVKEIARVREQLAAMQKSAPGQPIMAIAVEEDRTPADVKIHIRGNTQTLGDPAPRIFPRIIAGEKQTPAASNLSGRLEFAQWLTREDNPLTSRVMVNRTWLHHFGEGIVRSPDNFGKLGERPTHPELLDWLSIQFVKNGWSLKKLHRTMLLTSTYQMGTTYDAKAALADPENRLLWRAHRRRASVEQIRDGMLFVSGNLDRTTGGSQLKTENIGYVTNDQSGNGAQYDSPRRAIYLPVIRYAVYVVFQVFDFVEPSFPNGQRASTTVAPQALFLLNGQFVVEQSKGLADRLLTAEGLDDAARIKQAYLLAYGRPAAADEVAAALEFIKHYEGQLAARDMDAAKRRHTAWASFSQLLLASSEFLTIN